MKAINQIIENKMAELSEQIDNYPWENLEFYQNYLAQTYHYVFHSCRLLGLAAAGTRKGDENFYRRCMKHISEESGHDTLALVDLKRLGGRIDQFPEGSMTKAMWESQYYKVMYNGPTTLLGYILALELVTVRKMTDVYSRVKLAHGDKASHFLKVHVEEDPDHVNSAIDQISRLPAGQLVQVIDNYIQSCDQFNAMLGACRHRSASLNLEQLVENQNTVMQPSFSQP